MIVRRNRSYPDIIDLLGQCEGGGTYRVIGVHHQGVVPVPNVPPYHPRVEPRHVHPGRGGLVTACVVSPYQ